MNCLHFKTNICVLFTLWSVFAMPYYLFQCTSFFLGGEFSKLSTFLNKCPYLVHFMDCLCYALLLISLDCEFVAGELVNCPNFEANVHVMYILWIFLPCSVPYFNALWIFRR